MKMTKQFMSKIGRKGGKAKVKKGFAYKDNAKRAAQIRWQKYYEGIVDKPNK